MLFYWNTSGLRLTGPQSSRSTRSLVSRVTSASSSASSGGHSLTEADVHGNLWRGFENFLLGREVNDAITFTQRICGVCPVPHGMTSTYAADAVLGYSQNHITFADDGTYGVPAKAVYIRNIVLGSEFLMSSITHFYHLAAPSYVQGPAIPPWTPYFANTRTTMPPSLTHGSKTASRPSTAGFSDDCGRPSSQLRHGAAYSPSHLRGRRAVRRPYADDVGATSAVASRSTSPRDLTDRCNKFRTIMEEVGTLRRPGVRADRSGARRPLPRRSTTRTTAVSGYGAGVGNFLAWGAFPNPADDTLTLPGGVHVQGTTALHG